MNRISLFHRLRNSYLFRISKANNNISTRWITIQVHLSLMLWSNPKKALCHSWVQERLEALISIMCKVSTFTTIWIRTVYSSKELTKWIPRSKLIEGSTIIKLNLSIIWYKVNNRLFRTLKCPNLNTRDMLATNFKVKCL